MSHNPETGQEFLARELLYTLNETSIGLPDGISSDQLVNLTIEFFLSQPSLKEKIQKMLEFSAARQSNQVSNMLLSPNISVTGTSPMEVEVRPKKKMSKFDSLRPILNMLETFLLSHGVTRHRAQTVVLDIAERLITAGYGWDKILQYHSKGEEVFIKKLIPHIYMSKDEFPRTMTPNDVLEKMYSFMEEWKTRLYDMISFNTTQSATAPINVPNQINLTVPEGP